MSDLDSGLRPNIHPNERLQNIRVETFPLNPAERTYYFQKSILPPGTEEIEFWADAGKAGFADKKGEGAEKLGEQWTQFTQELFALGITGMSASPDEMTIFVNMSGDQKELGWDKIEGRIEQLMRRHLLSRV
jgi:hypothetical protein